jgi:DNA invertase Pin-like site-specific DNA recombinase
MKTKPLALLYLRVSTLRQVEGDSLETQEALLTARALANGYRVEVVKDSAKSGGKVSNRAGLKLALDRLNKGEAQALYVKDQTRLCRSLIDLLTIVKQSEKKGWHLVILDQDFDTSTPAGKLALAMLGAVAEWERMIISQRQKDRQATLRAKGEVWGVTLGDTSKLPSLIRERIVSEHKAGKSLRSIANGLNADKIPTQRGGVAWYASTVKHILNSPASRKVA